MGKSKTCNGTKRNEIETKRNETERNGTKRNCQSRSIVKTGLYNYNYHGAKLMLIKLQMFYQISLTYQLKCCP